MPSTRQSHKKDILAIAATHTPNPLPGTDTLDICPAAGEWQPSCSVDIMMKNKTVAAWLALIGGAVGLHRFYLKGMRDWLGWALSIPSVLGAYGVLRVQRLGLDDQWSWVMMPLLGLTVAGCALTAIVYGLMSPLEWNRRFNPSEELAAKAGSTNWLTVGAVVLSFLIGAVVLISTISFSFQHYFEYQSLQSPRASQ